MRSPSRLPSLAFLVGLVACGGSTPDVEPSGSPRGDTVRIVTWNVHDLFDEQDRTELPGDADLVLAPTMVEAKLAAIGRVLRRIDADVAILQEVENEELLQRLAGGPLAGGGFRTFLREGFDPRGIDVGVLSRFPFTAGSSHLEERGADGRRLWVRDPVEISLTLQGGPVVIVGAHLVSRLDPADDDRRRQQAARLRTIADGLRSAAARPRVLIVGDMNDLPAAPALAPLLGDASWVDLGRSLPTATAWTWESAGLRERIDYALAASDDVALVTRVDVEHGADVSAASDHSPMVVDIWLGAPGPR